MQQLSMELSKKYNEYVALLDGRYAIHIVYWSYFHTSAENNKLKTPLGFENRWQFIKMKID